MDDNIFMYHNLISLCRVCCSTKPRYDILYVRDILRYKRTIYFTFHKYYRTSIFYLMWDVVYMCTRICVLSVLFLHFKKSKFHHGKQASKIAICIQIYQTKNLFFLLTICCQSLGHTRCLRLNCLPQSQKKFASYPFPNGYSLPCI